LAHKPPAPEKRGKSKRGKSGAPVEGGAEARKEELRDTPFKQKPHGSVGGKRALLRHSGGHLEGGTTEKSGGALGGEVAGAGRKIWHEMEWNVGTTREAVLGEGISGPGEIDERKGGRGTSQPKTRTLTL